MGEVEALETIGVLGLTIHNIENFLEDLSALRIAARPVVAGTAARLRDVDIFPATSL